MTKTADVKQILKNVVAPLNQDETGYVAVSPKTGVAQCANCRFFLPNDYDSSTGNFIGPACVLVSSYPEPILATGWCNEHELRKPFEPEPLEVEIVDEADATEEAPAVEDETEVVVTEKKAVKVYIAPKDIPIVERLTKKVTGGLQPGTTLVRKGDTRYMLIVGSNGFKDRHDEHVATKALKEYVEGFEAGTVQKNDHMFWHAIKVGEIVAATMKNGFLIEIAKEVGEAGKKFYDYVEAHPEIDWGASQGFWVRAKDIREEGETKTFTRIDKDETSTLPRDAAANLFTLSAIGDDMKTKFDNMADAIFGPGTAEAINKGTADVKKHLLSNGAVLKKKDAETVVDAAAAVEEVATEPPADMASRDQLLNRMVDGMVALLDEVKATMAATEVAEEKAETAEEEVKSLRKDFDEQIADIRKKLSMGPRIASQATETELSGEEVEQAQKKLAPAKVTTFGGLQIEPE